jgi:hypothetical protein
MNVIILNRSGKAEIKLGVNFIPRIGDSVDMFYSPPPIVRRVIAYPGKEILEYVSTEEPIDALVYVG